MTGIRIISIASLRSATLRLEDDVSAGCEMKSVDFPSPRADFSSFHSCRSPITLSRWSAEILYWGFFEPKWWRNYLHTHSFFEICYAYAGEGTFRMNGADYKIRAGDVFVAKPTEPHEIVSSQRKHPLGDLFLGAIPLRADDRKIGEGASGGWRRCAIRCVRNLDAVDQPSAAIDSATSGAIVG